MFDAEVEVSYLFFWSSGLYIVYNYNLVRHTGHVDAYWSHPCIHMVWKIWLHWSLSVPFSVGQWQMGQILSGSCSLCSHCAFLFTIVNWNEVFKCHIVGHVESIYSCKKRWKYGLEGLRTYPFIDFFRQSFLRIVMVEPTIQWMSLWFINIFTEWIFKALKILCTRCPKSS